MDVGLRDRARTRGRGADVRVGQSERRGLRARVDVQMQGAGPAGADRSGFTGAQSSDLLESSQMRDEFLRVRGARGEHEESGDDYHSHELVPAHDVLHHGWLKLSPKPGLPSSAIDLRDTPLS
jgi:hypothetical protein